MQLDVVLRPRDPAALDAFVAAVSTPGSSSYGRYLAPGEFGQRFGAAPGAVAAVTDALRAAGLSPGPVSANDLVIPVRATAAAVSAALHVGLQRLRLADGRHAFANTVAPELPSSVAGSVQTVLGLEDVVRHHSFADRAAPRQAIAAPSSCPAARSEASGGPLTIDQLATAYSVDPLYASGYAGQQTNVAIYELEGNFAADVPAYESCFGISTPVGYVPVDGGPPAPSAKNRDGLESELDIENVIGVAPQARVTVYQAPNTDQGAYDGYSRIVNDDTAQVVSTSWGLCEAQAITGGSADTPTTERTLFAQAAAQGQVVFAAAGDNGSEDCTDRFGAPLSELAVDDPASQPYVVGVGGTSLTLDASSHRTAETVWNDGPAASPYASGAGGGGVSSLWQMPSWQYASLNARGELPSAASASHCPTAVSGAPGSNAAYCRAVPDVTADADPNTGYVIQYNGHWTVVGGTSGAAPLWAGLAALANSCISAAGSVPLSNLGVGLYGIAANASNYGHAYTDITSGENDYVLGPGVPSSTYSASTGYDLASGLGAPIAGGGTGVVDQLCGLAAPATAPTLTSLSAASGPTGGGNTIDITGTGFTGTPAPTVSFGATPATNVLVLSYNELQATVPAGSAGTVGVSVTTAKGTSGTLSYTYQAPAPLQSTSSSPSSTGTAGSTTAPNGAPTSLAGTTTPAVPVPASPTSAGATIALRLRGAGTSITLGTLVCLSACRLTASATTITAVQHRRGHTLYARTTVGRLSLTIYPSGRRTLTLRLNAAGRRALKRAHRLALSISINLVDARGHRQTLRRHLTDYAR